MSAVQLPTPRPGVRVVVAIALVAILGAALAFGLTGSRWRSSATVTVVPPQTSAGSNVGQNPLLRLDYDLPQLVTVLATAMHSPSAGSTLRRQGGTGSFAVATGTVASTSATVARSPQLRFTTESGSALLAQRTATALVSVARDQLDRLQNRAEVPGAARASIAVLAAPASATRDDDARWTAAGRTALVLVVLLGAAWFGAPRLPVARRRA